MFVYHSEFDRLRSPLTHRHLPSRYSALKMDGKPLYEYAREGKQLPRPIEPRKVTVHSIELVDWQEAAIPASEHDVGTETTKTGHTYKWPQKHLNPEQIAAMDGVRRLVSNSTLSSSVPKEETNEDSADLGSSSPTSAPVPQVDAQVTPSTTSEPKGEDPSASFTPPQIPPPVFTLKMTVSSGTYVRTVVQDLAHAVGSCATVVSLSRTRQGEFGVGPKYAACVHDVAEPESTTVSSASIPENGNENETETLPSAVVDDVNGECVPWEVFEKAIEARKQDASYTVPDGQREEWEEMLLEKLHSPVKP